jgi:hypothetical protein
LSGRFKIDDFPGIDLLGIDPVAIFRQGVLVGPSPEEFVYDHHIPCFRSMSDN